MKVPLSWLRELVDVEMPVPDLARRLTMAGLEVEEVRVVGANWRDVTIARVTDLERHPRLDSLNVARLDLGDRTTTVVTGAPNLVVGAVVPHVAAGGRLPKGDVGSRALGGITSEGMVCSGDELDISPDRDGIYLLEPDAPVGRPLAEYLDETVLDIYITANRPDCMSMIGIAREVHALTGAPLKPAFAHLLQTRDVPGTAGERPAESLLAVRIEDPVGCPRFTASVLRGIHIQPSPLGIQRRLHFAGVRAISNVVDVTNYVMLELGQPLHAFDWQRLNSDTIVVRRARPDEPLRTLDGENRRLTPSMLVVADQDWARSLAGVMGGLDSEIADTTTDVVIEGASWDRATIRLTSAALGLSSEASRRFGRGVDPDLTVNGVARATELTLRLAGGKAAPGVVDVYPGRQAPRVVEVRPSQIDALIGTHYPTAQVVDTLLALLFEVETVGAGDADPSIQDPPRALASDVENTADAPPEGVRGASDPTDVQTAPPSEGAQRLPQLDPLLRVTVPGHRRFDVEHRADLAEEVARVAGFESVPATMPAGRLPAPRADGDGGFADELRARRTLAAAGLQEVITYALVDPELVSTLFELDAAPLRVANPQSPEHSVLRPGLTGSLLRTLRSNLRQHERVLLFELARTWRGPLDPLPDERRQVGIVMTGPRRPPHWSGTSEGLDFFDLKGMLDALCATFHVEPVYAPAQSPHLHPGRSASVALPGGETIGLLGQLHPALAERMDLGSRTILVAELDFERLVGAQQPLLSIQTPSRFPAADRDIAIVVDEAVPHAAVEQTIATAGAPLLETARLFDVYRGDPIPPGRKSLAFALRYRAPDRTLEEEAVAQVHTRVEAALRDRFAAEVRGR